MSKQHNTEALKPIDEEHNIFKHFDKDQILKELAQYFKDAVDDYDQFEQKCLQDAIRDEDYGYAAAICIKLEAAKEGLTLANKILEDGKKDEA